MPASAVSLTFGVSAVEFAMTAVTQLVANRPSAEAGLATRRAGRPAERGGPVDDEGDENRHHHHGDEATDLLAFAAGDAGPVERPLGDLGLLCPGHLSDPGCSRAIRSTRVAMAASIALAGEVESPPGRRLVAGRVARGFGVHSRAGDDDLRDADPENRDGEQPFGAR